MSMNFMIKFVVKKGFLFSCDELSEILDAAFRVKVKITNVHGKLIICNIPFYSDIIENIKSLKNRPCDNTNPSYYAFWNEPQIKNPSVPSQIKKRDEIEWYLYCADGEIGVVHRSYNIPNTCTLIAEMIPETSGFQITRNCKIETE
uniref:Uncharacterized protein n=1 Tax=Panagrolaimus davidi TaxID=227884 RepID=A0A914PLU7_9BILA